MAACFQWLGSGGQSVLAREPRGQAVGAREDTIAPDLHTLDRKSLMDKTHIVRTYLAPAAVRALGCQFCQPAPRIIAQPRTRAYGFWQQPCLVWLGCIHSFSPNRTRDSVVECVWRLDTRAMKQGGMLRLNQPLRAQAPRNARRLTGEWSPCLTHLNLSLHTARLQASFHSSQLAPYAT